MLHKEYDLDWGAWARPDSNKVIYNGCFGSRGFSGLPEALETEVSHLGVQQAL